MIRYTHLAVVSVLLSVGTPASAQGLSFVPSFALARMYDDNVFYRPAAESDFTTRYSPRVDVVYDAERLTWSGRYQLDADQFDRHPQLSTAHARQDAGLDVAYSASRRLALRTTAAFVESQTPLDLNLEAAPAPGRILARRFSVQPSATYHAGPRTEATVRYTVTGDSLADGASVLTNGATATIDRHISPRTDLRFEYSYQRFTFNPIDASTSQAVTAEWTRSVARSTSLSLRAGPRVTDGVVSPEVSAAIHRQLRGGEAVVTYLHTTTTLLGVTSLADMHGVSAMMTGEPRPRLKIHAGPGMLRTEQGTQTSIVYRLSAGCEWPIARNFAVHGDYDVNTQRGNIYSPQLVETIGRNRLFVAVVAAAGEVPKR